TEGWPIALQLAARRRQENPGAAPAPAGGSLRDLFDYMAREVLEKLDAADREFLLATAPLSRLEPALCDALTGAEGAADRLRTLNDRGLFLIPLGGGHYRHHHLFREFLLERLAESDRLQAGHRAAAQALLARGDAEDAVDHWLLACDYEAAAERMAAVAPVLVDQGRYARLAAWLGKLPEALIDRAPALAICQGDACRLSSRFEEAIGWYDRALAGYAGSPEGRSRALASKALVYLDTVQPTQAERLLEEALSSTSEPRRRAELLVMRAENRLNQGDMKMAEALFREARAELPEVAEHEARVCLRTGRLAESRAILESVVAQAPEPESGTKSHREPALVLSLLASLTGEAERARALALSGLERARRQSAAWTEAVGLMRMGHAALVAGQEAEATGAYREAIALARAVGVPRLKAEPLMGLGLLAARGGDMAACESAIKEGLEVTQEAGDAWLSAMLGLALGAAWAAHGDPKAERWLVQAQSAYERCGDTYGQAVVTLWSARLALALGEARALLARLRLLSELVRRHDYGFLLTRPTLLGFARLEDARAFASAALAQGAPAALLSPWLSELGLAEAAPVPEESALRVRTLGAFRVWRGAEELSDRAWGREKARQLFHLLVSQRGRMLPKAQIIDALWPAIEPGGADGTFRVALNALNKALEPDRPSGQASRFVLRQGGAYGLAAGAAIWLDVAEFERLLDAASVLDAAGEEPCDLYRQALALYEGDFLSEFTQYEGWCERERERLAGRFSEAALRLSRLLALAGDDAGSGLYAQRVIDRDPCAEEAYRWLMIAQYRAGDRPMAIRTYDRCVVALSDELDVDPMPETQALYERIVALEPVEVE
ncbi:MAG: BTAD domain-containing putative transcriptional regulator, partial [Candidatus Sericytochromatia bacterium]